MTDAESPERLDMGKLFGNLRPRSRMSVRHAIDAASTQGVAATLVIQIPADSGKPSEIFYTTAPSELVAEIWRVEQF